jgi:CRISPR/Cas system CSM-associated protein Csm3 (group 7 of RAMP superfamily)
MARIELLYHLRLLAPLHIGTGTGFAKMVDDLTVRAGPARGSGAQLPCIPGSAVKGKVRSRCEALAQTLKLSVCTVPTDRSEQETRGERRCKRHLCVICRLFGSPYTAGPLHFSDALLTKEWQIAGTRLGRDIGTDREIVDPFALTVVRTSNQIERTTRTVKPDFLFSLEHTADDLQFGGSIIGQITPRPINGLNVTLPLEGWLFVVSLQAVDKIGGLRSRGWGRCHIAITSLKVDGTELTADLNGLLAQEDYLLGVAEYEA